MKKYKSFSIYFMIAFLFDYSFIYSQDDFEKFLKQQTTDFEDMATAEVKELAAISKEFDAYTAEQERLYQNFKDEVEKKWDEFRFSTNKTYVDYDDDLSARASIDFDKGEMEVEVIVEEKKGVSKAELEKVAKDKLEKKIEKIITKPAEDKKAILADQVEDSNGKKVTTKNAKSFSKEIVKSKKPVQQSFKSKDSVRRSKYTVKIKLLPNHLKTRADRYKDDVIREARRHNLPPSLAFAVMHTESSFNPKARSHIPAYGLMQLVPKSGARDAYQYLYKKDKFVSGRYLYKPQNNIELGCAYLGKLRNVYFKGVTDDDRAYPCVISAYNTGPGNVARTFTGGTKLKPTIKRINEMSSGKVYSKLKSDLPHKETRDYLSRVTDRMAYYNSYN